jgi:DNA-binding NarL/FixJ family response regulator
MTAAIRVVLADDHQILREGVTLLLQQWKGPPSLEVVGEAGTGPAAVEMVAALKPHVLVVDLALPGLGGIEVCRRVRQGGAGVVVLTMHVSAEHVRLAREAGAAAYVVKGSGISELADAISRVASGGTGPFPYDGADPLLRLTVRGREVLSEVALGRSNREIALYLGISMHTVNTHRVHLMEKLGVHDAVALTRLALTAGLL